jgi:hypothetical protein
VLILRFLVLLAAAAVGVSVLVWAFTGNRRYLRFAWRLFQITLAAALLILGLMFFERLLVIV